MSRMIIITNMVINAIVFLLVMISYKFEDMKIIQWALNLSTLRQQLTIWSNAGPKVGINY